MLERFSPEARAVFTSAADLSRKAGARRIESRFVLLGLLTTSSDAVARLRSGGVDVERLLRGLEQALGPWARFRAASRRQEPELGPDAKVMIEGTLRVAARLGDDQLESRHLALGMLAEPTRAGDALAKACADVGMLTQALARRPERPASGRERTFPVMDRFSDEAKAVLVVMRVLAVGIGALETNSRHLLLALLQRSDDVQSRLRSAGVDPARLQERLWHELGTYSEERLAANGTGSGWNVPFGQDLTVALNGIARVVEPEGAIESRHLVLGMLSTSSQGRGALVGELADPDALRRAFEAAADNGTG